MSWFEQMIRRYEHARWANEPNRRVLPFAWGLEHLGGRADDPDPRAFLNDWVQRTLASSDQWFDGSPAADYHLERISGADGSAVNAPGGESLVTFSSAVASPWPENNRVYGRFFPAKHSGPAVVVLAQWNSKPDQQVNVCRWLNALGITALRLSLPYHDRRAVPGHPRADHLVGPNIGLTLQANRQAVSDVRRAFRWLEKQGYGRLGILGTSIGSSVGFIAMAHDDAIRAGAFLHVSTYFGDVVANGLTCMNVWESLRPNVSVVQLRRWWAPISPLPYVSHLSGSGKKCLAIVGRYDPTFWPQFTNQILAAVRNDEGIACETLELPCGHYSLGEPPFSYVAGLRFGTFLFQSLT
jgi:hypothetical protein